MPGRDYGMLRRDFLLATGTWGIHGSTFGVDSAERGLEVQAHRGRRWTCYSVDPTRQSLDLFLYGDAGAPLRSFPALERHLAKQRRRLILAMNAGMFEADGAPVGWCVVNGKTITGPNTKAGEGNFYLKPNGVFAVQDGKAVVRETTAAVDTLGNASLVTQSGPMLVNSGVVHAAFKEGSPNRHIRNAVGVRADGMVWLAISEEPVSFHESATLFRDGLGCPNALFLDGVISRLHAPMLGRQGGAAALGPLLVVTEPVS